MKTLLISISLFFIAAVTVNAQPCTPWEMKQRTAAVMSGLPMCMTTAILPRIEAT